MTIEVIGREAEIAFLSRFLDDVPAGPSALALEGEPGIGKTTLWSWAVAAARERSFQVLSTRPAEAETKLAFAGLGDLLGRLPDDVFQELPEPQRVALEIALLRRTAKRHRPDQRAISAAALGALRILAQTRPVIVAVEDVHWLDASTARVLEYALRRLESEPIGFLESVRVDRQLGSRSHLTPGIREDRSHHLGVGPMSVDDIDRLLRIRLTIGLPHQSLLKLHRATGGNPFFALEIARALEPGRRPEPGEPLSVPENLLDLVRHRIAALPRPAKQVLPFVAALAEPTVESVKAAAGVGKARGLEEAAESGVLGLEGDRIRFTHPLLASAVYSELTPGSKRRVHRRLAGVAREPEERARHLALATMGPDPKVASDLEEAAQAAYGRGAPAAAADLAELAMALTPRAALLDRWRRAMWAGEYHFESGDTSRARAMLEQVVAACRPGSLRADAMRRLAFIRFYDGMDTAVETRTRIDQALREASDDASLTAILLRDLAWTSMMVGDLPAAVTHSREALAAAKRLVDPDGLAEALTAWGMTELVRGGEVPAEVLHGAQDMEDQVEGLRLVRHPSHLLALAAKWSGELETARGRFEALCRRAAGRGEESSLPLLLYHLSELECWMGDWQSASRHADEALRAALQTGQVPMQAFALYARALVDALLGRVDLSQEAAEEGRRLGDRTGSVAAMALNQTVLGFLELSLGNAGAADRHLWPMVQGLVESGIAPPSSLRLFPDGIEALVTVGDLGRAQWALEEFEERVRARRWDWARATADRCTGLVLAARGELEEGAERLERALQEHDGVGEPFERARTLLVMGEVQRRLKHKRDAGDYLRRALESFEQLGARLWSQKASAELERVGGTIRSPAELTPTERQVAEFVARGHTNREVADALFMSLKTVEVNLTRIYRKLDVRSRAEMIVKMQGGT